MMAVYGSSRNQGNTETLTRIVLKDIPATHLFLRQYCIKPVTDQRHDPHGFTPVDDDYEKLVEKMIQHDTFIFSTPLYWYGMSGLMKNFIDRWTQSLRDPRYDFKEIMCGKQAYVIITGGEKVRLHALPLIQQFALIFQFMSMDFKGYVLGHGGQPGKILHDEQALADARQLNEELKQAL
ncbi:MAG: flavodoxin family protein [Thermoactinomyces sp.]